MRYIAFVVLVCSFAAASTPVEVDPATKVQKRAPYWAARGWKELPLPPLTPEDKKTYDKYAEPLRADCPVAYERGYVQHRLVKISEAIIAPVLVPKTRLKCSQRRPWSIPSISLSTPSV